MWSYWCHLLSDGVTGGHHVQPVCFSFGCLGLVEYLALKGSRSSGILVIPWKHHLVFCFCLLSSHTRKFVKNAHYNFNKYLFTSIVVKICFSHFLVQWFMSKKKTQPTPAFLWNRILLFARIFLLNYWIKFPTTSWKEFLLLFDLGFCWCVYVSFYFYMVMIPRDICRTNWNFPCFSMFYTSVNITGILCTL